MAIVKNRENMKQMGTFKLQILTCLRNKTKWCATAILLIVISQFSCTTNQSYFDDFSFDRNAVLEISISKVSAPTDLMIYSRHSFPRREFKKHFVINQDTGFQVSLPSNIHDLTFIEIGNDSYTNIYTIPDDTLKISLNLDSELSREERISLEGSASSICDYYEAKRKNWIETKGYDYYYDSTISLQDFAHKMDRNRDNDLKFLSEYSRENYLPDWFIDSEMNNIIYSTAGSKMGIVAYHRLAYNPEFQAPDDYYSFMNEMKINNPRALLSSSYYAYLTSSLTMNAKTPKSAYERMFQRSEGVLSLIDSGGSNLEPRIEDILLGSVISILYRDKYLTSSNFQQSDSILEISKVLFHNQDNYQTIEKYRDAQFIAMQKQVIVKPGEAAPGFYLEDVNGNYVRLSDYSGKVVYLNFWASYCSPCIASIPEKNLLVEEFSDQAFELVNIYLDNKRDQWLSIIEDNDFAGTHLICKGNWMSTLQDRYFIYSVPHYTLIDKEGKIICNKCEKPEEIRDQLRLML